MVGVAQLVEPRIVIPVVAGSIPVVSPQTLMANGLIDAVRKNGSFLRIQN